jgi:bisphosphoglycerate-dependent phosphoglycerate mutase
MKKHEKAISPTNLTSGELPDPEAIPAVPEGDKPLDATAKQSLLKLAAEQRAEVDQAMEQLWAKRAEVARDLGTLAPDAERGKALHERMLAAREANRKAQALAAYTEEQEAVANHAVLGHVNATAADIEHMAQKNPQIAARYEKVLTIGVQRREAIVVGIARAKANKVTAATAATAPKTA